MGPETDERATAILWAVSLADPLARRGDTQRWRDAMLPNMVTGFMGELLAGVAVAITPDDPWRDLDETAADDHQTWWSDCYPDDDPNYWAAYLAPVPTRTEFAVMSWALTNLPGSAGIPPAFTIEDIEVAIKVLLARFRAEEPGIDIREFMVDVAEAAWALAKAKTVGAPTLATGPFLVPLDETKPNNYN